MLSWDDHEVVVGGTRFRSSLFSGLESNDERFIVWKPMDALDRLAELVDEIRPRTIVELGIAEGGSTALLAELCDPSKLVALDIRKPCVPLANYLERSGRADTVKPYYGIDQADHDTLRRILDEEFGDEPLDLVIDDASHQLDESRTSFDVLFPRLRPGGRFIIEDWTWGHKELFEAADPDQAALAAEFRWPSGAPMTILVFELVMAAASHEGLIDGIAINDEAVHLVRGATPLDRDTFRLAESYRPGGISIEYRPRR